MRTITSGNGEMEVFGVKARLFGVVMGIGNWSKDPVDQSGTYYPSSAGSSEGHLDWDPQQ
ncbi:phosphatidylinositol 4-phosphate 5-kinase 5-like, partial [Trifolium medium]|nr:phosphatidylinositol 4-phosphate 5-kinase 5-like [Trifolium medium]